MDAARSNQPTAPPTIAEREREALDDFRVQVRCALTNGGRVKCIIDAPDGHCEKQSIPTDVTSNEGLHALAAKLVSDHELKREQGYLEEAGDGGLFTDTELRFVLATPKLHTWIMDRDVLELVAASGDADAKRKLRNLKRRSPRVRTCDARDDEADDTEPNDDSEGNQ